MAYARHCERYTVKDLASGLLKTDPETGAALLPPPSAPPAATLGDAFRQALRPDTAQRQRVPVVVVPQTAGWGSRRFLCDCGRHAVVLYRPNGAERFTCRHCAHVSYKPPPGGDAAHKRYVRELVSTHGLDAVTEMAKQALADRLARFRHTTGNVRG